MRVEVRLPPATRAVLRALAELEDRSEADVVAAALERYEVYVRRPPRKRVHVVVG